MESVIHLIGSEVKYVNFFFGLGQFALGLGFYIGAHVPSLRDFLQQNFQYDIHNNRALHFMRNLGAFFIIMALNNFVSLSSHSSSFISFSLNILFTLHYIGEVSRGQDGLPLSLSLVMLFIFLAMMIIIALHRTLY